MSGGEEISLSQTDDGEWNMKCKILKYCDGGWGDHSVDQELAVQV